MSASSDDDLANNYGPTTPAPPKKSRARGGKQAVAGPSRVTITKVTADRQGSTIELDDDEDNDPDVAMADTQPTKKRKKATSEDSEEVVAVAGPARGATKKSNARAGSVTNGASKAAAAKGKARADPPAKGARVNGTLARVGEEREDVVELDEEESPDPPIQRAARGGTKQTKSKNVSPAPPPRPNKVDEKLAREVETLRTQLEQARETAKEIASQREKLAKQLEDVFRIRNTEAEEVLEEYKAHFHDSMEKKDALIEELRAQLSKSTKPDKSYGLHFLTREAAEEEKQAVREENTRLKDVVKQRDATITSKDKQIRSLQEEIAVMKKELEAEIERSKTLAARAPAPSVTRQQKPAPSELRNTPVIRLYEDITNILVTGVKFERNQEFPELEEEIMTCIYTYQNAEEGTTFSLNFSLRNVHDRPEDVPQGTTVGKDQLVQKVKYEPKDLDKERPEIVERLSFFQAPFMFARDQMTVFLKTLSDTVASIFEVEGEGESGEGDASHEVIVVE